jgi:hypothetical protein
MPRIAFELPVAWMPPSQGFPGQWQRRFSGGSGVANPVDRPGNVFDLLLAQILKHESQPVARITPSARSRRQR